MATYIVIITDSLGLVKERRITNDETLAGIVVAFYLNALSSNGEIIDTSLLGEVQNTSDGSTLSIGMTTGEIINPDTIYNNRLVLNQGSVNQKNLYVADIGFEEISRLMFQGTQRFATAIADTLNFLNTKNILVYQEIQRLRNLTIETIYDGSPQEEEL